MNSTLDGVGPESQPPRSSGSVADLILIFAISLSARLSHQAFVYWYPDDPNIIHRLLTGEYSALHDMDVLHYLQMALRILQDGGWPSPFFHPPLTAYLIAIPLERFGTFYAPKILFLILGSLTPVLVYLTARTALDRFTALLAGLLSALSFPLIFTAGTLNSECPAIFLLMVSVLLICRFGTNPHPVFMALAGLWIGLGGLCRTEVLLLAPLALIHARIRGGVPFRSGRTALFLVLLLLCLAPLITHNLRAIGEWNRIYPEYPLSSFSPIGLNGPLNFFIGNNPKANGGYGEEALGPIPEGKNLVDTIQRNYPILRHGYGLGVEFIRANPEAEKTILKLKLQNLADGLSFGFLNRNLPVGLSGAKRLGDCFTSRNSRWLILNGVLLGLGILLSLIRPGRGDRIPVLFPPILVSLTAAFFFGLTRNSLLALPAVLVFQSAALGTILFPFVYTAPPSFRKLGYGVLWLIPAVLILFDGTHPVVLKRTETSPLLQAVRPSPLPLEDLRGLIGDPWSLSPESNPFTLLSKGLEPFSKPDGN